MFNFFGEFKLEMSIPMYITQLATHIEKKLKFNSYRISFVKDKEF